MDTKTMWFFGILIVGVTVLLFVARSASEPQEVTGRYWPGTDIACLIFGHQNLAMHIHPELTITVDGTPETIPANIGLTQGCMAEVHTHDATGQIHIESVTEGNTFTLLDFFTVWGTRIDREGYTYRVFANGGSVDPATYTLKDFDRVQLQYTSEGNEPQAPAEQAPTAEGQTNFNISL